MMMISITGILFLLFMLGAAVGVLFLIMLAIQQKRFVLLAVMGGLAAVCLVMLAFVAMFFAYERHDSATIVQEAPAWAGGPLNNAARAAAHGLQEFHVNIGPQQSTPTAISLFRLLMLGGLACVLAVVVYRRLAMPRACGRRRLWPVLLAVPLLGLLLLGSVRYQSSS